MSDNQRVSHPLELLGNDEDDESSFLANLSEKFAPAKPSSSSSFNLHGSVSVPSSLSTTTTKQTTVEILSVNGTTTTTVTATATVTGGSGAASPVKCSSPEPSSEPVDKLSRHSSEASLMTHFDKFFISVDKVRWFYNKNKTSSQQQQSSSSSNQNNATTISGVNWSAQGVSIGRASSPTEALQNVIDSASESSNLDDPTAVGEKQSKDTTQNKWLPFSKHDSTQLELEYREMIVNSKRGADLKLVQVLNNLYEVDLNKKRCSAIYWDSGLFSLLSFFF